VKFDDEGFLPAFRVSRKGAIGETPATGLFHQICHPNRCVHSQPADAQPQDSDCSLSYLITRRPHGYARPTMHVPAEQDLGSLLETLRPDPDCETASQAAVASRQGVAACGADLAVREVGNASCSASQFGRTRSVTDSIVAREPDALAHRHGRADGGRCGRSWCSQPIGSLPCH
jgi:hypothetical protein